MPRDGSLQKSMSEATRTYCRRAHQQVFTLFETVRFGHSRIPPGGLELAVYIRRPAASALGARGRSAGGARAAARPKRASWRAGAGPDRPRAPAPSAQPWSSKGPRSAPPPTRPSLRRHSGPGPARVLPTARACARAGHGPRPAVSVLCRAPWPLPLPRRRPRRPSWPRRPGSPALGAAGCPR